MALLPAACENGGLGPPTPALPARLIVVSGDSQTARVATELPNPLVVRVVDSAGKALAGQLVTFTAISGRIGTGSLVTDDAGLARERWTLGTIAERQHLDVRVNYSAGGAQQSITTTFVATAFPDVPARLSKLAGDNTRLPAGGEARDTLVVRVADQYGNVIRGVVIDWSIASGGGTLNPMRTSTDSLGLARTVWTSGGQSGPAQVMATVNGGMTASFTLEITPALLASVTLAPGSMLLQIGDTARFVATLRDAFGNTVTGQRVAWSTSNANVAAVDSLGAVRAVGTGRTVITAGVGDKNAPAIVDVAAARPVVATVMINPASKSLSVGTTTRLIATTLDQNGNTLPDRAVAWSSSNVSIAIVDASGLVTANATGNATITATSEGVNGAAQIFVTAPPPSTAPTALVIVSGDGQSGIAGAALPDSLAVRVTDAGARPVAGVAITWAASAGGGSISPASSLTDASGIARARWTLGAVPGQNFANATLPGVASVSFHASGSQPPPTPQPHLVYVSGANQTGAAGTDLPNPLVVKAYDATSGQPLPNVMVRWRVLSGGGTITPDVTVTDANGLTQSRYTVGTVAATTQYPNNSIFAQIPTDSITFLETTVPGPIASFGFLQHVFTLNRKQPCVLVSVAAFDRFGNVVPVNPTPVVVSSDASIIQIVRGGVSNLACPVHNGTAQLTVQGAGFADTASVVYRQVVQSVAWSGHRDVLRVGAQERLSGVALDSSGAVVEDKVAHWTSSNPSVVNVDSSGLVTGVGSGRATITATIDTFHMAYPYLVVAQSLATRPATSVTRTSATFNGSVTTDSVGVAFQFIYGRDPTFSSYDGLTPVQGVNPAPSAVTVSENVTGLIPGVTYYYRIQEYAGQLKGGAVSFTTLP